TIVTVERVQETNLFDDPLLAAGALGGFYLEAVAVAPRGAWPLPLPDHYPADETHLAEYARLAATAEGFARYLDVYVPELRAAGNKLPHRGLAAERDRRAHRRRAPRRGRQRFADPRARRHAVPRARQRPAVRVGAWQPRRQFLLRRRARTLRLRRPRPRRRVLPFGRADRWAGQHQPGERRRLRPTQGALSRLVRLGLSLFCGAAGDPVSP